jgi:hypothetical protein
VPLQERYSAAGQEQHHSTSVPFILFNGNVQHEFLDFLMQNMDLLRLVDTPETSMTNIQYAFEDQFRRDGYVPPFSDIARIFGLFRPVIGTSARRQERASGRKLKTRANCPFQFCQSPFTTLRGLKSEHSIFTFDRCNGADLLVVQTTYRHTLH